MMDFLVSILGKYTYNAFSLVILFLQCQFCILLFMLKHKRRKFFALRYAGCIVSGIFLSYLIAVVNTEVTGNFATVTRVLCYNAVSTLNLATIAVCYKESLTEIMLCWCSGIATYQVVAKLYPLLQNIAGVDDKTTISFFNDSYVVAWYDWLIWLCFHCGCYILLAYVFRRGTFLHKDSSTSLNIAIVSVVTTVFVNGLICVSRLYEGESFALNIIIKIFSIAFGLGILFICTEIYARNQSRQEMSVIKQLWRQEQSQFASVKANIDYINSKCHDLKHLFAKLEGKLDGTELEQLKEAVQFYDNSIRTGNEILDVVLCEKLTLCASKNIRLTCMADGSKIGLLSAAQIYSLFGNIIDNAIEAVSELEDKEMRVISLTVKNRSNSIETDISNYYKGELEMSDGLPITVKDDAARHGYGLKSIRYIVQRHGGEMNITAKDHRFELKITFPLPKNSETATPPLN